MSNHRNHRRQEEARTEHGPRWESANPGAGCNSTHVAKSRKDWKKIKNRSFRRRSRIGLSEEATMPDFTEAFKFIESIPLSFGGPLHPVEDENGVINLCDENDHTRIMMSKTDYKDLVEYKANLTPEPVAPAGEEEYGTPQEKASEES